MDFVPKCMNAPMVVQLHPMAIRWRNLAHSQIDELWRFVAHTGTCATLQVVQRGCRLELYSSEGGKFPPLKAAGGWKTSLVVSSTNKRPKEMGEKKLQKIQMVSFLDSGKSAGTIFGNEKGWPFSILAPESIQNKELSGDP